MSLHAGQEKNLSWVQILIAKVTPERASGASIKKRAPLSK